MNLRAVGWLLGCLWLLLAAAMLVPAVVAAGYGEQPAFRGCVSAALVTALAGGTLVLIFNGSKPNSAGRGFFRRELLATVGLAWPSLALFGALPFLFSGAIPSVADALFESVAGFTTTAATVLSDAALDELARGLAFWRALTHWLGGMGIVVVFVLLFPFAGRSPFAESSGLRSERSRARLRDDAFGLLRVYVVLTAAHVALLWWFQRDLLDAFVLAFGTLSTGGVSNHGAGVRFFGSVQVELVIVFFMFLAGVHFGAYHTFRRRGWRAGWKALFGSSEVRVYAGLVVGATLFVSLGLWFWGGSNAQPGAALPDYTRFGRCVRDGLFAVVSHQSSTGYASANYDLWPDACRLLLVVLSCVGACAGSAGGGLKVVRFVIVWRAVLFVIARLARPREVRFVTLDHAPLDEGSVGLVCAYGGMWSLVVAAGTLLLLAWGVHAPGFEDQRILTAGTAVLSCLSNCGPGLAGVGPWADYAFFPAASKLLLAILMILGRLEFAALFVLLMPRFWRV